MKCELGTPHDHARGPGQVDVISELMATGYIEVHRSRCWPGIRTAQSGSAPTAARRSTIDDRPDGYGGAVRVR